MANIGLPDDFSIGAPLFDSVGIAPYGPSVQIEKWAKEDSFNDVKDIVQVHESRINCQDQRIYEVEERVKEALMIVKYPGLIANRVLDKVDSFISKHKKTLTDKQGQTVEMVEVSKLDEMVRLLREVVKNGHNNEGL